MSASRPSSAKIDGSPLVSVTSRLEEVISSLQRSREALQAKRTGVHPLSPAPPPAPSAGSIGGEVASLRERLGELEAANRAAGDELASLQAQIEHMVCLFAVLRRLHEAADRTEVLDGLSEAVVNILGCEQFVILLAEGEGLRPVRAMGLPSERAARLASALAASATRGELLVGAGAREADPALTALVPLLGRGRFVGAIAMEALLPQRRPLDSLDAEVMELLGLHGALALLAAPENARGG